MSRTKKAKTSPGKEYWSKRPIGKMSVSKGTKDKRPGIKQERSKLKQSLIKEVSK